MRMSSGPSKRKEKPRAGLSICGELTPRSSSNPSHRGRRPCREQLAAGRRSWLPDENAGRRSAYRLLAAATASGSLSKAISRPSAQPREQRARMAAAAEGRVDVGARRRGHERIDRFVQQDGGVLPWLVHPRSRSQGPKTRACPRAMHARPPGRRSAPCPTARSGCPCRAAARRGRCRPRRATRARPARGRVPSISTSIALPRKTRRQSSAEIGSAAIGAELFPVRARKDHQAAVRMLGDRQAVVGNRLEDFAVARGHGHAALAVERQPCPSLEYEIRHAAPLNSTFPHFNGANRAGQRKVKKISIKSST